VVELKNKADLDFTSDGKLHRGEAVVSGVAVKIRGVWQPDSNENHRLYFDYAITLHEAEHFLNVIKECYNGVWSIHGINGKIQITYADMERAFKKLGILRKEN